VHLRHPPNQVQRVVLDALAGVANIADRPPPDCILESFEESWARYAVRYRLCDYQPDDGTDSEVRKRIWYALHRHEIEIPYPGHNIFVTELNQARVESKSEKETRRRLDALSLVHIFDPLSSDEKQHLAAGLRHEVFAQGEVILRVGEAGDSLYLVRDGMVSVQICADDGCPTELAVLRDGAFFGEMSLLTGSPRAATVVARQDTDCYVIDSTLFQQVIAKNDSLAHEISHILAARAAELAHKREGLHADKAPPTQQDLLGRIKKFFGLG
jgi:CRP-like cAMP-binding protein